MSVEINSNQIPKMSHPFGKYWAQPHRNAVRLSNKFAYLSQYSFGILHNYSRSQPSGVYEGKMWKAKYDGEWYLCWFVNVPVDMCRKLSRKIKILG